MTQPTDPISVTLQAQAWNVVLAGLGHPAPRDGKDLDGGLLCGGRPNEERVGVYRIELLKQSFDLFVELTHRFLGSHFAERKARPQHSAMLG